MKMLDVTIRNFGSFEGQQPPFTLDNRGLVIILGKNHDEPRANSNGSGKSMILDAIDWCLFGVSPRGDKADAIINERVGKDCEVVVRLLDDDGRKITVVRTRGVKKAGLTFEVADSETLVALDNGKTQERLEELLGLDRDVFHAAVFFGQFDDWRFADATDAERKALLSKIIPELQQIDDALARTKELRKQAYIELGECQRRVEQAGFQITTLHNANPTPMLAEWENNRQQQIEQARAQLEHTATALQQAQLNATAFQTYAPVPTLPEKSERVLAAEKACADASAHTRQTAQARVRSEGLVANIQKSLHSLDNSATCHACGQSLPGGEERNLQRQRLQQELAGLQQSTAEASGVEMQARRAEAAAQATLQNEMDVAQQGVAVVMQQVQEAQRHNSQVDAAQAAFRQAQQNHAQQQAAYEAAVGPQQNPWGARVQEWTDKLTATQADLARAKQLHAEIAERIYALDVLVEAFGPKGLKSHLLDTKLQTMSDEANRWLKVLFGGTVWVRFETQTEKGKGKNAKLVDEFNVRVFRYNPDHTTTERRYKSWCGGEKHRISTGIDFGIARLIAKRAKQNWDVLFLDEIFGKHLDASGKEAVAEMLYELQKEKSSIFVVDHDTRFQSLFEETVLVEKRNSASTITESSHNE